MVAVASSLIHLFEGNNPSFPCNLPSHQSALVSSTISITSPALNDKSAGSCNTINQNPSLRPNVNQLTSAS